MDFTIKNAFGKKVSARDIIVFQDSTKMAMIVPPETEGLFSLTDLEDYLTINVNAFAGDKPFEKDFKISYPMEMADHLVYSLGKENIKVDYEEVDNMGILRFSAGPPEWQLLISGSISGSDQEDVMLAGGLNTTVTIAEEDQ